MQLRTKLLVNLIASSIIRNSFYKDCNKYKDLKMIEIWSPYKAKQSKKQLLKKGYDVLGD